MKNPNLKSAQAHMSTMLDDLRESGCVVIGARLDQFHTDGNWFKYHIHVLNTLELTQWIGERGYKVSYDPRKRGRGSIPFPDGEVFYLV